MWTAIVVGWLLVLGLVLAFFAGAHRDEIRRCYHCGRWYGGSYKDHSGRMHGRAA